MNINSTLSHRRHFIAVFIALICLSCMQFAKAQPQALQSSEYRAVPPSAPENSGVMYFFWYGAPHAYDLSPELNAWISKSSKVKFQMVPVAFREDFTPHSQIFYTLQELGRSDLNLKVMNAIHTQNKRLLKDDEIGDWVESQGLNRQDFLSRMKSASVATKVSQANELTRAYGITGVPNFVVNGRYITGPAIAGSKQKTFQTIDSLLQNPAPAQALGGAGSAGGSKLGTDEYKNKCKELGFKVGTEEFGKCVLQLSK